MLSSTDTLGIGSAAVLASSPSALSGPSTAGVFLEGGGSAQTAGKAARGSGQKKKTGLRYFFWGKKDPAVKKRKKELLKELTDLQQEYARLQSECTEARQVCSELKQERLMDLEKASKAKAQQRRMSDASHLESSACQTDSWHGLPLPGEFRGVPRKNYAFVYSLFTVPTPEQLKKSLEKFQKSRSELSAKIASKSAEDNAKSDVEGSMEPGRKDSEVGNVPDEPSEEKPGPEVDLRINQLVTKVPIAAETGKTDYVRPSSPGATSLPAAPDQSSDSLPPHDTEKLEESKEVAVLAESQSVPVIHDVTSDGEQSRIEDSATSGATEVVTAKTKAESVPSATSTDGTPKQPSAAEDKKTEILNEVVVTSDDSNSRRRSRCGDGSDNDSRLDKAPAEAALPPRNKTMQNPSESSLLLKLRQAVSSVTATLQADASVMQADVVKRCAHQPRAPQAVEVKCETLQEMVQRDDAAQVPVASRHFLSSNQTANRAHKDPGRKEFEKRRRVSSGSLRPPGQKAIVMTATGCPTFKRPGSGASNASRRSATTTLVNATGTPRPLSSGRPTSAQRSAALAPPSTPLRPTSPTQTVSGAEGLLNTPVSETDSLSCDSDPDTDCAADDFESSSDFHASERNVARTALQNRTSGYSRTRSQTSGRSTKSALTASVTETPSMTAATRKKFRKKRNSPRRVLSTVPSFSSSTSDDSVPTPSPGRRTITPSTVGKASTLYSSTPTASSRATNRTSRRLTSATPVSSPDMLSSAATSEAETSRPTTGLGTNYSRTTTPKWTDKRGHTSATSSTMRTSSAIPTPRPRNASSASKRTLVRSRSPKDLTSSELSPTETDASPSLEQQETSSTTATSSENNSKGIFGSLTSAGYTAFEDDGAVRRTAKPGKGNQSCGVAHGPDDRMARPVASQADQLPGKNSKDKSYVVQRAEYLAPFPPKIMKTLLPSFIEVDPSVRPDKAPRLSFPDSEKHGDVKSNTCLNLHCHQASEKELHPWRDRDRRWWNQVGEQRNYKGHALVCSRVGFLIPR
ncbi:uncharacterized protein LOC144159130 isoform X2 [Haemaphysalis longicornis]